jgi:hypothetical protein
MLALGALVCTNDKQIVDKRVAKSRVVIFLIGVFYERKKTAL